MTRRLGIFDDDVLGNPVAEVVLRLVAGHVDEGQHGDRGFVGKRRLGRPGVRHHRVFLPQPLVAQPILEGRVMKMEPGEQLLARARGPDRDLVRIQGDGVVRDDQSRHGRPAEILSQPRQHLTQRRPGLDLAPVGPKQRHDLLAAPGLARRERQIGQQTLGLPRLQRDLGAVRAGQGEAAENGQPQHGTVPKFANSRIADDY
jgi:hypothetical protein